MKCRADEKHTHFTAILCDADSPHHAALHCVDCKPDLWLKWLSKDEMRSWDGGPTLMEELHEAAEEAGEDVRIPNDAHTRLIVRDELAKILQAMADAIK